MKIKFVALFFIFFLTAGCFTQGQALLIEDFEGGLSGGAQGTVDFGAGGGSEVAVSADGTIKNTGRQSLKATYEAITGGYMWIAKGVDLDAQNAGWLVSPKDIVWEKYSAVSFYMYGSDSKTKIAFDIKDNGNEMWRFIREDNFTGWKQIIVSFDQFFCRGDWQPSNADKNANLDFPLKSFQFEPLPEGKGVIYFDTVELIAK